MPLIPINLFKNYRCKFCQKILLAIIDTYPCNDCNVRFVMNSKGLTRVVYYLDSTYKNAVVTELFKKKTTLWIGNKQITEINCIWPELTPLEANALLERILKMKAFI